MHINIWSRTNNKGEEKEYTFYSNDNHHDDALIVYCTELHWWFTAKGQKPSQPQQTKETGSDGDVTYPPPKKIAPTNESTTLKFAKNVAQHSLTCSQAALASWSVVVWSVQKQSGQRQPHDYWWYEAYKNRVSSTSLMISDGMKHTKTEDRNCKVKQRNENARTQFLSPSLSLQKSQGVFVSVALLCIFYILYGTVSTAGSWLHAAADR